MFPPWSDAERDARPIRERPARDHRQRPALRRRARSIPHVAEPRARRRVPRPRSSTRCASSGLFGVTIPEEYGGLGLDLLTYIGDHRGAGLRLDEPDRHRQHPHDGRDAAACTTAPTSRSSAGCPSMATGERRGALSLSEPDAGSDTRNISCRAERDGDEYVINGTKAWVTNGERAGLVALAARTERGHQRVHRREGARAAASRASRSASTSASSATRASRRSRWPTPTTASRPPT